MFNGTADRNTGSPPPLAGGGRGRGFAPAGACDSDDGDSLARYRAQTPPPTPSRKGRGGDFRLLLRACASLSIIALLSLGLSACGKRGDPVPPDGKTDEYPRQYPDPSTL
jgi:hypothetical protein